MQLAAIASCHALQDESQLSKDLPTMGNTSDIPKMFRTMAKVRGQAGILLLWCKACITHCAPRKHYFSPSGAQHSQDPLTSKLCSATGCAIGTHTSGGGQHPPAAVQCCPDAEAQRAALRAQYQETRFTPISHFQLMPQQPSIQAHPCQRCRSATSSPPSGTPRNK